MGEGISGKQIKRLRDERHWNQARLARETGVSQSLLSELESGKRKQVRSGTAVRIADVLGITLDELAERQPPPAITGSGGVRAATASVSNLGRVTPLLERVPSPWDLLRELAAALPVPVPHVEQRASAGPGGTAEPEYWYQPQPGERGHEFVTVDVSGDCLEPRLHAGQTVIVDKTARDNARPGNIVMALHEGETILKILEERDGEWWLVALQGRPPLKVGENTIIQGVARMYTGWL